MTPETPSPSRRIAKSSTTCRGEIADLLQGIFTAELIRPSTCLWIVSPWVSDIAVIDNRVGAFSGLDPTWGQRHLRLSEVLRALLRVGGEIRIATRPDRHNDWFFRTLQDDTRSDGTSGLVTWQFSDDLHTKGLLGDDYYLGGSMNLTYNGVQVLEETVTFETDPEAVARTRLIMYDRWGGRLLGNEPR